MEDGLVVLLWLERQQNILLVYGIRYVEAFKILKYVICS